MVRIDGMADKENGEGGGEGERERERESGGEGEAQERYLDENRLCRELPRIYRSVKHTRFIRICRAG